MQEQEVLQFGGFTLDLSRQVLRRGDQDLTLRPQSFDVLRHLAERAGTVVSKDDLIEAVWDRRPASDDSVMQCVKDIRRALGEGGRDTIKTIAKRGYLFAAEVTRDPAFRQPALLPALSGDTGPRVVGSAPKPFGRWAMRGSAALVVVLASAFAISRDQPSSLDQSLSQTERMTLMGSPSVTVLPFLRMDDAQGQRGRLGSIAADIAAELSAGGRGIVFQVKTVEAHDAQSTQSALPRLGTRYAVLGSVQGGDTSRINVRLLEAASNLLVWGQAFDGVQKEAGGSGDIATHIAQQVAIQILAAEAHRPLPLKPSAEDYALLGRARLAGERGVKANRAAQALFEQGLALDANSVTALLGMSRTLTDDVLNGWAPKSTHAAVLDRAEGMVQRALELQPRMREGHLQRGILARARKDIDQAIAAFEHTLELSPHYPHAHGELGRALMELGRADEAIAHLRDAIRLSPTDSALYIWCLWAGMAAVHAGDYEMALRWLRRSREANHSFENTLIWLALAHAGLGQIDEAQPFLAEFMTIRPRFTISRWGLAPPYRNQVVAQQREKIAGLMLRLGIKKDEDVRPSRASWQQ